MAIDTDRTPTSDEGAKRTSARRTDIDLVHQIDRRSSGPDRVTVFPADATDDERMSSWLTVDADCVTKPERFR